MSNEKIIPQIEMDQATNGAMRARYTAYVQHIRRLEMRKAASEKHDKTEKTGGTAL